jgi:hypothetical protein
MFNALDIWFTAAMALTNDLFSCSMTRLDAAESIPLEKQKGPPREALALGCMDGVAFSRRLLG